jgi:IS1 family transposase
VNTLPLATKAAILKALTEGSSIRATARMTGVSKTTILKLLVDVGEFCQIFQNHMLRRLPCKLIKADVIWGFIGAKARNAKTPGYGDAWTFIAIDPETKLVVSWLVGHRFTEHATLFMKDLASRLANRIQLSTDGLANYLPAVAKEFNYDVDYAQLQKKYGVAEGEGPERRYSPAIVLGTTKTGVSGKPVEANVSTSHIERANLGVRMNVRRMTRLTNGFSKKMENHARAIALHFFVTNFCRPHMTLTKEAKGIKTTPAMAAGLATYPWTIEKMLDMMNSQTPLWT